jgi:hypothetical protein
MPFWLRIDMSPSLPILSPTDEKPLALDLRKLHILIVRLHRGFTLCTC